MRCSFGVFSIRRSGGTRQIVGRQTGLRSWAPQDGIYTLRVQNRVRTIPAPQRATKRKGGLKFVAAFENLWLRGRDLNPRPLGYEGALTNLPEATRQRTSPISLIVLWWAATAAHPKPRTVVPYLSHGNTQQRPKGCRGHVTNRVTNARAGGAYGFRPARFRFARRRTQSRA